MLAYAMAPFSARYAVTRQSGQYTVGTDSALNRRADNRMSHPIGARGSHVCGFGAEGLGARRRRHISKKVAHSSVSANMRMQKGTQKESMAPILDDLLNDGRLARLFSKDARHCALQLWILQIRSEQSIENRVVYGRLLPYSHSSD
ncbi:hypothetical protein SGO26_29620 (plasmid) [Cupriavidus metallidurans]|uniref:hypothetical protein n=1 Tax=Cupriavidus metallidurans TaxID=119219 RepID=UPI003D71CA4B